jgi:hypothetical protein
MNTSLPIPLGRAGAGARGAGSAVSPGDPDERDGYSADGCRRARAPYTRHWALLLAPILAAFLTACGGGGGGGANGASSEPPSGGSVAAAASPPATNHYVGTVKIGEATYFGDAVLTRDGVVRLYIGGRYGDDGSIQKSRPSNSDQFVGTAQLRSGQWSGSGVIVGQQCASSTTDRFCGHPAAANIVMSLSTDPGGTAASLQGAIQLAGQSGTESWLLDLHGWPDQPFSVSAESGQFKELLAEFAVAGDVIVNFDSAGKLFFQSAKSGCVGNGALAAHLDGSGDTVDVTLQMENCSGAYAYLNGSYEGLALITSSSVWDYDVLLRVWLSKGAAEPLPAAVTMLGEPL